MQIFIFLVPYINILFKQFNKSCIGMGLNEKVPESDKNRLQLSILHNSKVGDGGVL